MTENIIYAPANTFYVETLDWPTLKLSSKSRKKQGQSGLGLTPIIYLLIIVKNP